VTGDAAARRASTLALALALAAATTDAQPAAGREPRFEARVDVVKVSALVRGAAGPILGLTAADFELRDNGVPQPLERVLIEESPLDVIMAFDVSGSVKGERLAELKGGAHALVDGLRPGDRAALLTFADSLRLRPPLREDLGAVRAGIDGLVAEGGTSLLDGTFAAIALGDAVSGRVLAVVFTDGVETVSRLPEADVLDAARRSEVVVYGVRVGGEAAGFLGRAASETGGRLLSVGGPGHLRAAFLEILAEFRTRYLLSYTPRGVDRKGWHRIDVRVKTRSAKVLARKGYLTKP
jgi:VWFA-related protein